MRIGMLRHTYSSQTPHLPYISLNGGGGNGLLIIPQKYSWRLRVKSYVYEKRSTLSSQQLGIIPDNITPQSHGWTIPTPLIVYHDSTRIVSLMMDHYIRWIGSFRKGGIDRLSGRSWFRSTGFRFPFAVWGKMGWETPLNNKTRRRNCNWRSTLTTTNKPIKMMMR